MTPTTANTSRAMISVILVFKRRRMIAALSGCLLRSASYSFSLLCSVFRLIPSSSAARVLLLVAARVCRISSRSMASTVVPRGKRSDGQFGRGRGVGAAEIRGQVARGRSGRGRRRSRRAPERCAVRARCPARRSCEKAR